VRLDLSQKFVLAILVVGVVAAGGPPILGKLGFPAWGSFFVALLVGTVLGAILTSPITSSFRSLRGCTDRIASGDLTAEVEIGDYRFPDETVDLSHSVRTMLQSLRELLQHIQRASDRVALASRELSQSTQHVNVANQQIAGTMDTVARGAVRQQQHVEETSKRIRDIASAIRSSAEAAREAFRVAEESSKQAAGLDAARDTTAKMQSLFEQVEKASALVIRFDEKIRSVQHIAEMITNVAEKTHLLSLNASIEAARAGDAGRGFSVVADEIRKLAESTGNSAEQIDVLIRQVEEEAGGISEVMRQLGRGVGEGRQQLDTVVGSLETIQPAIRTATRYAEEIFDQADRQAREVEEVVGDIDDVSQVATENVRATEAMRRGLMTEMRAMEEMVAHATALSEMSVELEQVAKRFKAR
jgi:methyl-accepting chemotaxis protein